MTRYDITVSLETNGQINDVEFEVDALITDHPTYLILQDEAEGADLCFNHERVHSFNAQRVTEPGDPKEVRQDEATPMHA